MRTLFIAAFVALPVLAGVATADEGRMSTTTYIRASQCLALNNVAALQSDALDLSALSARFEAENATRLDETKRRGAFAANKVTRRAAQADTPNEIAHLKANRDRLCSSFAATPEVAQN